MKRRMLSLFLAICMVLGMLPVTSFAADIPDGVNFSAISGAQSITGGETIDFTLWGMDYSAPSYTVTVPEGTETVTITFASDADVCTPYTNSSGVLKLSGCRVTYNDADGTYSASGTESDCVNMDGVYSITLDVAAMIANGQMYGGYSSSYSVLYLLNFVYGEAETSDAPFLSIAVDGEELADDQIIFRTLFDLGSLGSMYAYIHEDVPYYHVIVPCGTTHVDVTYSADTNIFDSGSDAYGYATELEVDAVSSATVKGRTFRDAYTMNEDGTQTVKTPVTGYTFDENGYGMAITLEEEGGTYEAVCLFSFEYDRINHVYTDVVTAPTCTEGGYTTYACTCGDSYESDYVDALGHSYESGVCTVCGQPDPNAAHTHSYEAVVTAPTCTESGYTTYTCACGDSYIADETAATGHSYEAVVTAPTCTEGGYTTYTCACGDGYTADEIAATGHSYENGVCSSCGEKDPDYVDPNAPEQDENGIYHLAAADDLLWFAETVNGGETGISAVLTGDIDLTGVEWPSIGTSSSKFAGSFDGQGHTVSNLNGEHGLFGHASGTSENYVTIKNVTVEGTIANTNYYVGGTMLGTGGIIGSASYVNVENCVNRANISAARYGAGIVGYVYNTWNSGGYVNITGCGNEGTITCSASYAGGILGYAQVGGQVTGCYNTGAVSGTTEVGGIAGYLQQYKGTCFVKNCFNTGKVTGSGNDLVGGLIGSLYNSASVENCYNAGEAYYAVAGNVYNKTASVSNTYYLDSASTEAVPASDLFDSISVASRTHEEMRADDFAAALGDSFRTSCPYPVLNWQNAVAHDYVKGVCDLCQAVDPGYVPEAEEPEQVDGVYQIGSAEELFWFAAHVNEGNTSVSAVLTADIDLQSASWTAIGTSENKFAGSFDGRGHKVTNLFGANGLFGYVEGNEDANAVIQNVTVDGTITGTADYVGGIAGSVLYTTIENCVNCADITSAYSAVGGITGGYATKSYNTITGCGNEGTVGGANRVGGIIGMNSTGVVEKCWNLGAVSGTGKTGGIAGESAGFAGTVLDNCYNKGRITGGGNYTGGIVGSDNQTLTNCYNWGTVIGENRVGGIAGYTSTVPAENCYNAGFVSGAENVGSLVGSCMVNQSTNCYYLEGTAATSAANATVKTVDEMKRADFATTLGDAFKQGGLYPILYWQADETAITTYAVTIPQETGYTVMGTELAIAGEDYSFSVTLTPGYMEGENFAVTVNGETVTSENGVYTVPDVVGDLTIAVAGVELEPLAVFTVTLPATGNGYAVKSVDGYNADSVLAQTDYKFTVEFANGFKAGEDFTVKANDVVLTAVDGVYTIEVVTEDQTITVSGVEMIPMEDTVSVNLTITYGEKQFYTTEDSSEFLMLEDLEVPYFDIALYDLEKYYYNPCCYVDASGNPTGQKVGNVETAYGVVTLIHTFIYVTEVYYLDYDPADAGKGISHQTDSDGDGVSDFAEVLNWTGGVGSSFMNLWNHGTNLNYYVNYVYPLGTESWGATSDQIALEDGDIVSLHLIQDEQVSGSNFSVFTANDADNVFSQEDTKDTITVKQGEAVKLTLYWTGNGSNYTTIYDPIPNWALYWSHADDVSNDIRDWTLMDQTTGSDGTVTIDTTDLEPGIYYIGSLGGKTAGGTDNGDGFISRGGETGAGVFKLVVEAADGEEPGDTTVIPEGAPFVSITTDVEGAVVITDQGAVDFDYYSGISYYHVELPAGATEVYVTYSADTNFYLYNNAAYAYSVSIPEFEMGYASGSFATAPNDDGTRTVTIPVENFLLTDGAGSGIALEDTNWNPVNLFTFSHAEAEEDEKLMGDVNMDGIIDTQDANLIVSYYYGSEELTGEQLKLADVDGSGIIDIQDANLIVSYYYGNMDAFPGES